MEWGWQIGFFRAFYLWLEWQFLLLFKAELKKAKAKAKVEYKKAKALSKVELKKAQAKAKVELAKAKVQAKKELAVLKKKFLAAEKKAKAYTENNPEKAMAIAAGVGAAIGAGLTAALKGGKKKK